MQPLTDFEKSVLDFERGFWTHPVIKHEAIWQTFDVPPTRYFQFLSCLINKSAALEHDPLLVRRLRRQRHAQPDARRPAPDHPQD